MFCGHGLVKVYKPICSFSKQFRTHCLSLAYLGICKGKGETRGSGGLCPPAGSGVELQNPVTFGDFEADFEAP